ncbi:unnamed protein product, partial [Rotaria magnacalcarata]
MINHVNTTLITKPTCYWLNGTKECEQFIQIRKLFEVAENNQ